MISTGKRITFIVLMLALSLAIPVGCAEIVVRMLTPYRTPDSIRDFYSLRYVPTVPSRHMLKPEQDLRLEGSWDSGGTGTGKILTYKINHAGYRGPEIAVPKPKGIVRVVILGGSSVFDPAASEGEDWPRRIQQKLRSQGYDNVEIINGGVPAHASFDSLGRLYSQVWTFEPDFVLIYHAWNDIKSFVDLAPSQPPYWVFKPYDPSADPFQNTRGALDRALCHSQLYVKLRNRYLSWVLKRGAEGTIRVGPHVDHYDPTGVEQYRLDLGLLAEASREIGATPVLMTQATLVSPNNSETERRKIGYDHAHLTHEALLTAFGECNLAVEEVGERKGVAILDAQGALGGRPEFFADHVHLSKQGGEVLSDLVSAFLSRVLGPPHAASARRAGRTEGFEPGLPAAPAAPPPGASSSKRRPANIASRRDRR